MGTEVQISVSAPAGPGVERAIAAAFEAIDGVENMMSEWRPDTELSRVNRLAAQQPVVVDPQLARVLGTALDLCRRTKGAFDPSWAALKGVWRFEPGAKIPSNAALKVATDRIGCQKVSLDAKTRAVRFGRPGMVLGLGAIAKGYAVDQAASVLRRAGFANFIVSAGGDMAVHGRKTPTTPWRVGIQHPRKPHGTLLAVVEAENETVVTSGDYERFVWRNGKRYHHIIDPRTGMPAEGVMSVTVIATRAMAADALATAAFVMGPKDGLALLEAEAGAEGLVVDSRGQLLFTSGAKRRLKLLTERVDP